MPDAGSPSAQHISHSADERRDKHALLRFIAWMFSNTRAPASPMAIFTWWEARRLPFNLIIGMYGILCLVVFFLAITSSGHLKAGEDAVEPLALVAAPIVVNVLYTLGWIVELAGRSIAPDLPPRFGPRLLKAGLGLGLFLSTLPAAYWAGYRVLQWAGVAA
jgi:hypothetical protein